MKKNVLLIAFHFPPFDGSSGIQRSLKFAKFLPSYGWNPIVLSASPLAYADTSDQLLSEIPKECEVYRSFALDAQRHLSWKGRYPDLLSVPDRFSTWILSSIIVGLNIIRKHKPAVIWSTYPLASAHVIALALSRITGIPWVADFRDPMTGDGSNFGGWIDKAYPWIEAKAVEHARACVFVTDTTHQSYSERFINKGTDRFHLIENGYDEEDFAFLNDGVREKSKPPSTDSPIILLHTGSIYFHDQPKYRGPGILFEAIRRLRDHKTPGAERLRIHFRGAGLEQEVKALAAQHGVSENIVVLPNLKYKDVLQEMTEADALLLLQGPHFSRQIPAKLYEYLRVGKPVIGLCGKDSATAEVLNKVDPRLIAALDQCSEIESCLRQYLANIEHYSQPAKIPDFVHNHSRYALTGKLGSLLDTVSKR